jgi:hypothetical protein
VIKVDDRSRDDIRADSLPLARLQVVTPSAVAVKLDGAASILSRAHT